MNLTMGQIMLYGGILLAVIAGIALMICMGVFSAQKKKMIRNLSNQY